MAWLLVGVALGALLWWQALAFMRVSGDSMAPTLPAGSVVVVVRPGLDRLLSRPGGYVPGDVVAAAVPGGTALKRVAAVGPASVGFSGGVLSVDDEPVAPPNDSTAGVTTSQPLEVPAGSLYLLGDDRRPLASRDSRDYGPVSVMAVRGRVVAAWSPTP